METAAQTKEDLRLLIEDLVKPQRFAFVGYKFDQEAYEKLLVEAGYVFDHLSPLLEWVSFGACFDPTKRIVGVVAETDYLYIDQKTIEPFKDVFCRFSSVTISQNSEGNFDIRLNTHNLWVKENE